MSRPPRVDALVVGAGPAGMAAALRLRHAGLSVRVVDDAPAPGGQIWRAAEANAARAGTLGADYARGIGVAERFRACGADYRPGIELWRLDPGWQAHVKQDGALGRIDAGAVVLATGALERPVPFPGWTLPGVVTVGGAQTLLKAAGQVPTGPVWIAGSGPLVLLYAAQILALGGAIAGWLDTAPAGNRAAAALAGLRRPRALSRHAGDLMKGLGWRLKLALARVPVISVRAVAAEGEGRIAAVRFVTQAGREERRPAQLLLVHEGVVPNIHATLALDCVHDWCPDQECFAPRLDAFRMTSRDGLFVAGDGGGILGARGAAWSGTLAALGVLARGGHLSPAAAAQEAGPLRRRLASEAGFRAFLDALYRPRRDVLAPSGETLVCRCEEVSADAVRRAAALPGAGPNQIKAFTRTGMGPCQGRQCAATLARLVAEVQGRSMESVGCLTIRPPLKPVTVGELAQAAEQHI
ncbi:NAD(P)/FAD-dependent oxidoreductase [Xanthobacter sp. KR7-225]|uniref:NAD(P)/FAD-dependent oxidoreductase n=1 Tax=Xanthobacter sp. KR7-225 TaxID=3156613 RepID=UPI0032B55919